MENWVNRGQVMKRLRGVISILLMGAFLLTAIPAHHHPGAVNSNDALDLEDAIIHVRNLYLSVNYPEEFKGSMEGVIESFKIVAGLKKVIKSENTPILKHISLFDTPCLISSCGFAVPRYDSPIDLISGKTYPSRVEVPETPPPRTGQALYA